MVGDKNWQACKQKGGTGWCDGTVDSHIAFFLFDPYMIVVLFVFFFLFKFLHVLIASFPLGLAEFIGACFFFFYSFRLVPTRGSKLDRANITHTSQVVIIESHQHEFYQNGLLALL